MAWIDIGAAAMSHRDRLHETTALCDRLLRLIPQDGRMDAREGFALRTLCGRLRMVADDLEAWEREHRSPLGDSVLDAQYRRFVGRRRVLSA